MATLTKFGRLYGQEKPMILQANYRVYKTLSQLQNRF